MPNPLELPGMLRAVVPLMRGERVSRRVVTELIAGTLRWTGRDGLAGGRPGLVPGFAAIVGALDDLAEPSAGLRSIYTVAIDGRTLEVIHFPPGKVRAANLPFFALAISRQNECALA